MIRISKYWQSELGRSGVLFSDLNPGRTWNKSDGTKGCAECCNGDRCDDPTHKYRPECSHCLGSGLNRSCYDNEGNIIKEFNS
jgi:hypothetical protein